MKELQADGIVTCGGGTYSRVDLRGVINVESSVNCEAFLVEGVGHIKGDVQAHTVKITGTCKIEGNLQAEKIECYGVMNLKGDLTGDHITVEGALDVEGEINADSFSLLMSHGSSAREVNGQSCIIRKGKGSAFLGILRARKHQFVCQSMECDQIDITYSSVQRASGQKVTAGAKCKIGLLEYAESYSLHESAKADTIRKRGEQP